jgi:tetratricopeptide (TPR) repeat protein
VSETLFEQYKAALRRGHVAALAGQLEDALAAYDDAAHLVPERALPLASQGTVLHRLDRWTDAASAFDRALELAPDDETALRARATAREERGLRAGAAADFERLAFVLDVAGRASLAAEAARRAADLEPSAARAALAARLEIATARGGDPPGGPTGAAAPADEAGAVAAMPDDP